ncbi:MAG: hypothetical protein V3R49_04215 [Gammaproteobacteria bacterium]
MSNILAVLLNGVAQLEYNRDQQLPPHQALYLEKMDTKMDEGIQLGDAIIPNPDINQRAQFVAGNLADAILNDQESAAAALCSYLAKILPDLKQMKITQSTNNGEAENNTNNEVSIELVFDEHYQQQVPVQFLH